MPMNIIQGMPLKNTLVALEELIEITKNEPVLLPVPLEGDFHEISKELYDKLDKISEIRLSIALEHKERGIKSDSMLYMTFCRINSKCYVRVNDMGSVIIARDFLKHHIAMCEGVKA
jgi:hypothetical protein